MDNISIRINELTKLARNFIDSCHSPVVRQNSLSAYLSSSLHRFIELERVLEICVTYDSSGPGHEEKYDSVAEGIREASFISNESIISLLQSNFKFIGISALTELALKLQNATLQTLNLFVEKTIEQPHEPVLAKNAYNHLLSFRSECKREYHHHVDKLLHSLENYLKSCFEQDFLDTYPPEKRANIELPFFDIKKYIVSNQSTFSHAQFKELRELKRITRKHLSNHISTHYKPITEKSIACWESGEFPISPYAIRALLELPYLFHK